jgi:hypothetical protein
MSLYHHITGREDLLDELADWVCTRAHSRRALPAGPAHYFLTPAVGWL